MKGGPLCSYWPFSLLDFSRQAGRIEKPRSSEGQTHSSNEISGGIRFWKEGTSLSFTSKYLVFQIRYSTTFSSTAALLIQVREIRQERKRRREG